MYIRSEYDWLRMIAKMPKAGPGIRGKDFLTTPFIDWERFKPYFDLKGDAIIIDVGCGHGRMALNFINTEIRYVGFDIIADMIEWNAMAFNKWENIKFCYRPWYNTMYNPDKFTCNFKLPFADKTIKGVLGLSLFTHLETTATIKHYLMELRRALCGDGTMLLTFFLSPPNVVSTTAERTVISKWDLYYIFTQLKIKIIAEWGGDTNGWHDQKVFVLRPA